MIFLLKVDQSWSKFNYMQQPRCPILRPEEHEQPNDKSIRSGTIDYRSNRFIINLTTYENGCDFNEFKMKTWESAQQDYAIRLEKNIKVTRF